ncbi:MAG: DUF1330 domain-containing protein [Actinomycetia bacterium]|nr:DUF1330 domain-containing protein [Actinomycetes bacterium]
MSGYVIITAEVNDESMFREFVKRVPEAVVTHGGKYLVRGGKIQTILGDWEPSRVVVIEFDSFQDAVRFMNSPELEEIRDLREKSADVNTIVVEGV